MGSHLEQRKENSTRPRLDVAKESHELSEFGGSNGLSGSSELSNLSKSSGLSKLSESNETRGFLRGGRAAAFLLVLFFVSALCQIDRILPFILAESIKRDLHLSDTELGLITGIAFAVCHSIMSLPLAHLADRGSPRLVLSACLLAWSAMTAVGGFASSTISLAFSRLGVATGEAGAVPAGHALIARNIAPERRGFAIGLFSLGIPVGAMVGFGIGGIIGDAFGWRTALFGAGAIGALIGALIPLAVPPTPAMMRDDLRQEPFLQASLKLLMSPVFRWLFGSAIAIGFATAPFYAFAAPFLIRAHGLSVSEAGMYFGALQGLMGLLGTPLAGRGFDRAVAAGRADVLRAPAIVLLISAFTTTAALFAPTGWMTVALFVPQMFGAAFLLPWAFGAAHLVAGPGKQALASSLVLIGAGLFGPALGPLLVGMISDAATAANIPNGLRFALLLVPFATLLASAAAMVSNRRLASMERR